MNLWLRVTVVVLAPLWIPLLALMWLLDGGDSTYDDGRSIGY